MDYEKKYKEAVNKIKNLLDDGEKNGFTIVTYKTDLESIFPELTGSEDEKVRKEIVEYLKKNLRLEWATWLEKQGEQKSQRMISAEAKEAMYNKPTWSEEDEYMLESIVSDFAAGHKSSIGQDKWLKSLKTRYIWKPSEEQLRALHDINLTGNISYSGQGQELINLYNDLKNLRKE